MQPVEHAIISCAGMGSRLELNMPKCLIDIHGRCLIDYLLDLLTDIDQIRIVVGFMEDEVISHVRKIRDDAIFVRNPDFHSTSNTYSLWLATRDLQVPFLTVDGDTLIEPTSFRNFCDSIHNGKSLIGITPSKTQEAVFVELDHIGRVTSFRRTPMGEYEWCGVAYLSGVDLSNAGRGFLYNSLETHLPLDAQPLTCFEVDTPEDLDFVLKNFQPLP
jgi:choline kinase